jgi:alginate O-acetyltransferase complex protein AlgJ
MGRWGVAVTFILRYRFPLVGGRSSTGGGDVCPAKTKFQTEPYATEITGDLAKLLNEKNPVREKLALTRVFHTVEGKSLTVADDPQSPILLLGDSHTLIFHDPTLYAEGCGLADHLAEQLGIFLDVIGVRGSGANAARLNWRRRAEPLAGKKLVIWCFSMREFTENTDGWRVIPMTKR